MEFVVRTGAISHAKLQSNHPYQQTNTNFLQARCPSCCQTNSVKAPKLVMAVKYLPSRERLARLKLPRLIYRRARGNMIEVYKILNNKLMIVV